TVGVTLIGSNLSGAALVVTGTGISITNTATPDDATLTATLTISPSAPTSATDARLLIVTTESGQTTIELFVVPPDVPSVTVVSPGAGEPGQIVPVTIRGLNLTGAALGESSPDLSLQNPQPVDDQTVLVEVVGAGGAAV